MAKKKRKKILDVLPIVLFIISVINLFMCAFLGIISLIIPILITIWTVIRFKEKDILYFICLIISIISIGIFVCVNYFGLFNINNHLGVYKENKFVSEAQRVISISKDDYISRKYSKAKCYKINDINKLGGKLNNSPSGVKYSDTSFVKIYTDKNGVVGSSICLVDENGIGFNYIDQYDVNRGNLDIGDADLCILPSDCK